MMDAGNTARNVTYHDDVSDYTGTHGEFRRLLFFERVEVEAHSGEKVFGLTDVHPEPAQLHTVQLPLGRHLREHLLLYARGANLEFERTNLKLQILPKSRKL